MSALARARSSDFGVNDDERPPLGPPHLCAQQVEVLGRGRRLGDPEVAPGGQGQEPLDPGRGVLGTLSLVPVRQQQDQSGRWPHLSSAATRKLSTMISRAVPEVAELRLPGHQVVDRIDRVAVLEADGGVLRQQRVEDGEPPGADVGEGDELLAGHVVDQHRVTLREGAAAGVLAGHPHVGALEEERAEGQRFAERPVDLAVGHQLVPLLELALELRVEDEALGHRAHDGGEAAQPSRGRCRSRPG